MPVLGRTRGSAGRASRASSRTLPAKPGSGAPRAPASTAQSPATGARTRYRVHLLNKSSHGYEIVPGMPLRRRLPYAGGGQAVLGARSLAQWWRLRGLGSAARGAAGCGIGAGASSGVARHGALGADFPVPAPVLFFSSMILGPPSRTAQPDG